MKTKLQKDLALICPSIVIRTRWTEDKYPDNFIFEDGNGLSGEDPDDWQAWDSAITAHCIIEGEEVGGAAYLGGTWEKYGEDPATVNPEISGYENQMTVEALEELRGEIEVKAQTAYSFPGGYLQQIDAALAHCKAAALASYEAQRAALSNA